MSDWSMYELKDIVWDVFGETGDHIVPHPGPEQLDQSEAQRDSHKKARHDVPNAIERNAETCESPSNTVFKQTDEDAFCSSLMDKQDKVLECSWSPAPKDILSISSRVIGLASDDTRTTNFFNDQNIVANNVNFCSDCSVLGNAGVDESAFGPLSLDNSPADTDLDFLENELEDRENTDLLGYGWPESPDFGNFEDFEKMFRNDDSKIVQGSTGNVDDLSWYSSSSYIIDGSKDALTSSEHHRGSKTSWHNSGESITVNGNSSTLGYKSYTQWSDADGIDKEKCASKGQVGTQGNLPTSVHQSESKRKGQASKYTSGSSSNFPEFRWSEDANCLSLEASASETYPLQLAGTQDHLLKPDSSGYLHLHNSHVEMNHCDPSQQIPVLQPTSCLSNKDSAPALNKAHLSVDTRHDPSTRPPPLPMSQKMEELHLRQQLQSKLTIGYPSEQYASQVISNDQTSAERNLYQMENQSGVDCELQEALREHPRYETGLSALLDSSCTDSTWSTNTSLGPASLRKLQDAMDQLDTGTKLCIRDGLYRLAKNAEQRMSVDSTGPGCVDNLNANKILGTGESKKCSGFMDSETGTNPIDRFIAHLLFHGASEYSTSASGDAMPLKSHIANKLNFWPTVNQLVPSDQ